EREFKFDPVEKVKADRGKYLAAVFTMARAYIEAGCPRVEAKPLAGFIKLSKLVRNPLILFGYLDVGAPMEDTRRKGLKRVALRLLIDALLRAFGTNEFTSKDILEKTLQLVPSSDSRAGYYQTAPRYPDLIEAFTPEGKGRQITTQSISARLLKEVGRR